MSKPPRDVTLEQHELRIKIATRKTIKAAGGTALAAEIIGARQQRLSDAQLNNVPEFLRANEVVHLEAEVKGSPEWPAITRAQARQHGFALLPLPEQIPDASDSEWHQAVAEVSAEVGELVGQVCKALGHGAVTRDEVRDGQWRDEIAQAISGLAMLDALCAAAEARG